MLQAIISHYPVQVLTPSFLIHGQMEPMGPLLDFLNDVNRDAIPFTDATLYDLAGKIKPSQRSLIVIGKKDICGLYIDDEGARASVRLLKRVEKLIIHMPNLVYRGGIHLGTETRLPDIFEVLIGQFFGLTEVSVFPLVQLPAAFPQQADLLLAHKDAVQAYYPE